MQTTPIQPLFRAHAAPTAPLLPAGQRGGFGGALARAEGAASEEQAREAAEQLVSLVLVEPILAAVRESSQAAPPFAPTSGEKQFRAMLDAELAQEITRAARFPLVERLARDLRNAVRTEAQETRATRPPPGAAGGAGDAGTGAD